MVDEEEKYSYTPVSKIMSLPDITVTPYKKPSMKVAGSYTITKQAEEDGFALNISSLKNVESIEAVEVQNAIVGGKLGEFTNYFSISDIEFNEEVGKYVGMVSVSGITDVDENDRTIIVPKAEDLVGFVTFRLTNEDGQYELMTVKIQVKIKK